MLIVHVDIVSSTLLISLTYQTNSIPQINLCKQKSFINNLFKISSVSLFTVTNPQRKRKKVKTLTCTSSAKDGLLLKNPNFSFRFLVGYSTSSCLSDGGRKRMWWLQWKSLRCGEGNGSEVQDRSLLLHLSRRGIRSMFTYLRSQVREQLLHVCEGIRRRSNLSHWFRPHPSRCHRESHESVPWRRATVGRFSYDGTSRYGWSDLDHVD